MQIVFSSYTGNIKKTKGGRRKQQKLTIRIVLLGSYLNCPANEYQFVFIYLTVKHLNKCLRTNPYFQNVVKISLSLYIYIYIYKIEIKLWLIYRCFKSRDFWLSAAGQKIIIILRRKKQNLSFNMCSLLSLKVWALVKESRQITHTHWAFNVDESCRTFCIIE